MEKKKEKEKMGKLSKNDYMNGIKEAKANASKRGGGLDVSKSSGNGY